MRTLTIWKADSATKKAWDNNGYCHTFWGKLGNKHIKQHYKRETGISRVHVEVE